MGNRSQRNATAARGSRISALALSSLLLGSPFNPALHASKAASTIAFDHTGPIVRLRAGGVFTNRAHSDAAGPISYSISDPRVAAVDKATGEVVPLSTGAAVVSASQAGASNSYSLTIIAPALPVLAIHTRNSTSAIERTFWSDADAWFFDREQSVPLGSLKIKGRGATSWKYPKKSYSLKFTDQHAFAGRPPHRRWLLLANFPDKTLLRNKFAFMLGHAVFNRLSWTPASEFVEVTLNGDYLGVYQLTDAIRAGRNRLNLDLSAGDFLIEIDQRHKEKTGLVTRSALRAAIKFPEDPDPGTHNAIIQTIQSIEDAIYSGAPAESGNGYASLIDVDSFVDWYLINEFTKNNDAIFFASVYMHYKSGRLYMGPIWDFDIAAGNINYNGCDDPTGYWIRNAKWIEQLFEDPAFQQAAINRWNERRAELLAQIAALNTRALQLSAPARNNFLRWDILRIRVPPAPRAAGSYEKEVAALTDWLHARFEWMDAQINP